MRAGRLPRRNLSCAQCELLVRILEFSECGHSCPMPLGFEAQSHACQRRFGRQRQSGGPFPLTPALSPEEREPRWPRYEPAGAHDMRKPGLASPSPWGEGRGEGELSSRPFHGASSSVQVTLQTRGQFLAALDILVRRWACGLTITQRWTRMSTLQSPVPTTLEKSKMCTACRPVR